MRFSVLMVTLFMAFTFGCAPTIVEGRKIDSTKLEQLFIGQTKVANVKKLFGKPDKIEKLPSGEENYFYGYCVRNPPGWTVSKLYDEELEIIVKDGVVQTYTFIQEKKESALKE
jgi:hypothetical protein